jgi:uncharacterized protein (DUF849 family)
LEDALVLPEGTRAGENAKLVAAARRWPAEALRQPGPAIFSDELLYILKQKTARFTAHQ